MDNRISKLLELTEALEKAIKLSSTTPTLPSLSSPKAPVAAKAPIAAATIKQPDLAPTSKKNPLNQAQQIKQPDMKDQAIQSAKEKLTLAKNGQWSLDKAESQNLVHRIDDSHIADFNKKLGTYHSSPDGSSSGQFGPGEKIPEGWKSKTGLFAGEAAHVAPYAAPRGTSFVTHAGENGEKPTLVFGEQDKEKIQSHKPTLTSFSADGFQRTAGGEHFSPQPGKPVSQTKINNPIEHMSQHYNVKFVPDLKTHVEGLRSQGVPHTGENLEKSSRAYQIKHHSSYNHVSVAAVDRAGKAHVHGSASVPYDSSSDVH